MKYFEIEQYDGRPVVLCGTLEYAQKALPYFEKWNLAKVFVCDPLSEEEGIEEVEQKTGIRLLPLRELGALREAYVFLCGKLNYTRFCKALGYGFHDFYMLYGVVSDADWNDYYLTRMQTLYTKQKGLLILPALELVLTERCSLRCRDCANLMQYYHHPRDVEEEDILHDFRKLLHAVDGLGQLKLLGGEPLLAQKTIRSVLHLLEEEGQGKVFDVRIITNGTLLFEEETLEAMKHFREHTRIFIYILFSNYGDLSRNLEGAARQLGSYGIGYGISDREYTWTDFGALKEYHHSDRRMAWMMYCCASKDYCHTMLRGVIYHCPRIAHGVHMGVIPIADDAFVDLTHCVGEADVRESVEHFLHSPVSREVCKWCALDYSKRLPQAVQADKCLEPVLTDREVAQ